MSDLVFAPPLPPEPIPPPSDTQPIPKDARVYISTQGDVWDMIAIKVYGEKRGNENLMFRLIEANYPIREVSHFPAGIPIIVPEIDIVTVIPLVPWKNALRGAT